MTTHNLMDSPEVNGLGWAAVLLGWCLGFVQYITEHGNNIIVGISGVMGIIFLYYKIRIIIIEYREKLESRKKKRK